MASHGIPHLKLKISDGSMTLINPDCYSLDHHTILRIIASNQNTEIISNSPITTFTPILKNIVHPTPQIAFRYTTLSSPILNLNSTVERKVVGSKEAIDFLKTCKNKTVVVFDVDLDFLAVKKICRNNCVTLFATGWKIEKKYFDNVLNIKALNGLLGYHGLIETERCRSLNTIDVEYRKTRIVGYKIKKEGIIIEDVILPE